MFFWASANFLHTLPHFSCISERNLVDKSPEKFTHINPILRIAWFRWKAIMAAREPNTDDAADSGAAIYLCRRRR